MNDAQTLPTPGATLGGTELERVLDGTFAQLSFNEHDPAAPDKPLVVTERVKIKKISIQRMDMFAKAFGNFPAEVAVYIDRPAERVAQLTDEAFTVAMQEGRRLNFTSFETWFRWQSETLKGLGQGNDQEKILETANELMRQEIGRRLSGS